MARGRPPASASPATRSSSRNGSVGASASPTGRLTRASSTRGLSALSKVATADRLSSPDPISSPATGRSPAVLKQEKDVAVDKSGESYLTAKPSDPAGRGWGRVKNEIAASSDSAMSALTSVASSDEADLSTPATSKMTTPAANDGTQSIRRSGLRSSIEVQLPARTRGKQLMQTTALDDSIYSLTSKRRKTEVLDSEDDDYSDTSPDAQLARRLQAQLNGEGKAARMPAQQPHKRARASTARASKSVPPAKKSKVDAEAQHDAEIAAGVAWDSDESLPLAGPSSDESGDEPEFESMRPARSSQKKPAEPAVSRSVKASRTRRNRGSPGRADARKATRSAGLTDADLAALNSEVELEEPAYSEVLSGLESALSSGASLNTATPDTSDTEASVGEMRRLASQRRAFRNTGSKRRQQKERDRLEHFHPEIKTMWTELESMPVIKAGKAAQPQTISRQLKPFQLEGLAWMMEMEKMEWRGGLLGDEMGLGKTIQAVSLVMSDYPAKQPSLVLVPPVALMQWQSEIKAYTDGTLKTFVFHGTNQKTKGMTVKDLKKFDVIMMSYNSLESMYRKQEKGFTRKNGIYKEKSLIHAINFHRIILDEAHSIKTRTTMTAKACFALKTDFRWCLSGTPLQNRIGEFFSLIRFLNVRPFASYLCKQCPCSTLEWSMDENSRCSSCKHAGMQHVSVFNQELLNPIQKFGNLGPGREAFMKLRLMTDRIMLRRLKKDHTNAMELPVKEVYVDRQFFGEEENDFANSIMTSGQRKFDTYVAQGVLLNNYANIFGLIMQMRQVADHPDLILKKHADGGQNVLVCCICDEPSEDTVRSRCKHDFCRACVASYVRSTDEPDCPRCHLPLSVDLEQPEIEQDESLVKKTSIINRIKMENWTSSSKIELLVHELHKLRSDNASHKSIIFSQFTTMLQLIEWRLRRAGITTVMLDGSMTPAQRQASIEHFMNNVDVECFLVSLKAGGVALNLTEASRVFIVDPWWNPAAEWQSADRCHRIGQTRPCTITRLCIEDSVESRMVLIQEKKTNMIHSTVNGDDKAMESLTPEDMQFLFRGS